MQDLVAWAVLIRATTAQDICHPTGPKEYDAYAEMFRPRKQLALTSHT
jgi:hypothetical protein